MRSCLEHNYKICNRVVNELSEGRKNCYHNFFKENKNYMKILWNGIKNIVSLQSNNLDIISYLMDDEGSRIYDPRKMANEFNHFFTNVANDITKTIPRTLNPHYISQSMPIQRRLDLEDNDIEFLIGVIYRAPDSSKHLPDSFNETFESLMSTVVSKDK